MNSPEPAAAAYPLEPLDLSHASTVERAAEALRQALFAGDLPPGTPLREVGLAESLGVSRSTLREALSLLTSEGLVTRVPNRGVSVTTYDPEQVSDVMRARLVLESAGVRERAEAAPQQREAVREAFGSYARLIDDGAPVRAVSEAHLDFHISLVALTGSSRLLSTAQALAAEIRLALSHVDRVRGDVVEQRASHRRLLELLESGDTDGTVDELADHLAGGETSVHEALRP